MLFRQNIIEFTNLKETYIRGEILFQNGRIENFVGSLGPWGLNQILVGTDRRHLHRTFNGI